MSAMFPSRALLALQTAAFIAYHGQNGTPVKSSHIIARYRLNNRALEPILQTLARANIVESKQGANGGYLISAPERITLAAVVAPFIEAPCVEKLIFSDWRNILFDEVATAHQQAFAALENITLGQLMQRAAEQGMKAEDIPAAPLDFII